MEVHSLCTRQEPPKRRNYNISPDVARVLEMTQKLPPELFHELTCELIKKSPCNADQLKKQMNLARETISGRKKNPATGAGTGDVRGHQSNDDSGASSTVLTPPSSENCAPAATVGLIYRGDLISRRQLFFLDTEKVKEDETHSMVSGDLAIVDERGKLVMWCYIKKTNVCTFNTKLTGLNANKLKIGVDRTVVQSLLNSMFKGKTIVGAAIKDDLTSLGVTKEGMGITLLDIQDFYKDSALDKISLGYLAYHFTGEDFHKGTHTSIKDARMTAIVHRKAEILKKQGMTRFACPILDEMRKDPANNPKNKVKIKYDSCSCGRSNEQSNPPSNPGKKRNKRPKPKIDFWFDEEKDEFDVNDFF